MSNSELSPAYILRLPPELHDRIIDHLHTDTPALDACSLTCRSFLPAARFHRFRHWKLQLSSKNSAQFQQLLLNPHVTLAKYIDFLMLQYIAGDRRWQEDMAEMLPALSHVMKLRLYATDLQPSIAIHLADLTSSVRTLEIGTILITPTFVHLLTFITAFPNLHTLAFIGPISSVTPPTDADSPEPALPTLSAPLDDLRLTDHFHYLPQFVRWASAQGLFARLRALSFYHGLSDKDTDGPDALFAALGPTLEHLNIINAYSENALPLPLARCTRLRSLAFTRLSFPLCTPAGWVWPLPALLTQVETHSVERVALTLTYAHPTLLAHFGWVAQLEGPLSRPEFDGLKELIFELPVTQLRDIQGDVEEAIRSEIPVLNARGVVVVRFF
ncbi:hypothetical protein B0H21DRAFT_504056 [Amylocystis lapponica]|nr:hypothetical protein B0H21DRAFT_504056 [Amylocystis lapponica]